MGDLVRPGDGFVIQRDVKTGQVRGEGQATDKQKAFARLAADGYPPQAAARMAGYATPEADGYRLSRTPKVVRMIEDRRRRRLSQGASVSLAYLQSVVTGGDYDPRLRVKAAIALIAADQAALARDQANRIARENPDAGLSQMSLAEMQEHARKLIQRIEKAKVIDHDPSPADVEALADRLTTRQAEDNQPVEKTGFSVPAEGTGQAEGAE